MAITQAIENEHKLKIAGATKVISVESMSARLIFNIMQKPAMSEIFNEIVFTLPPENGDRIDFEGFNNPLINNII